MRLPRPVVVLASGIGLVGLALFLGPLPRGPLYDGVVVTEPYRFLEPASGESGDPTSFEATVPVTDEAGPAVLAATSEVPPQAQLIAAPGAFILPPGIAALSVSVRPVAATQPPSAGAIAGNVYRFSVSDPGGGQIAIAPDSPPSLTLRAPDMETTGRIARLDGNTWTELPTQRVGGQPAIFLTNPTELGDFAIIVTGTAGFFGLDPAAVILVVVSAIVLIGLAVTQSRHQPSRRGRRW
jgi:hypothetical protein